VRNINSRLWIQRHNQENIWYDLGICIYTSDGDRIAMFNRLLLLKPHSIYGLVSNPRIMMTGLAAALTIGMSFIIAALLSH
jgi:hypothetical protein